MSTLLRRLGFVLALLFIGSLAWQDAVSLGGIGSLSKLLGVAAFGVTALATARGGRIRFRPFHVVLAGLIGFTLLGVASALWSIAPSATLSKAITFAQLVAMVWLVWEHGRSAANRDRLIQAYLVGGFVTVGIGFSAFFGTGGFRSVGDINANDFAMVVVVGIPLAWYLVLRSRPLSVAYWFNLLYIPAALISVVLSASRGGLLMSAVALLVIPLTFRRLGFVRQAGLIVLTVVATWSLFTLLPEAFPDLQRNFERLGTTTSELREGTLSNRRIIWDAGLQVFRENPVFGVGLGAFDRSIEAIYGRRASAHSSFLSVAVELGVVGALVFIATLVLAVLPGIARPSPARIAFLIVFATMVVGMIPLDLDDDKSVWFVVAVLSSEWPLLVSFRERSPAETRAAPPAIETTPHIGGRAGD